jgi:hypothetical protein
MCVARNRTDELLGRVFPFAVVGSVTVDPLLQNDGRLEHLFDAGKSAVWRSSDGGRRAELF